MGTITEAVQDRCRTARLARIRERCRTSVDEGRDLGQTPGRSTLTRDIEEHDCDA